MNVGKTLGLLAAGAVSGLVATGIVGLIALDLLGEDVLFKAWQSVTEKPAPPQPLPPIFKLAENMNYFARVPSEEHRLVVITGVAFETVKDFEAGRQRDRWCYVIVDGRGGLPRHINLGTQSRMAPPVYSNLSAYPPGEFALTGLSARTLETLAKTHCRFAKSAAAPPASTKGGRA